MLSPSSLHRLVPCLRCISMITMSHSPCWLTIRPRRSLACRCTDWRLECPTPKPERVQRPHTGTCEHHSHFTRSYEAHLGPSPLILTNQATSANVDPTPIHRPTTHSIVTTHSYTWVSCRKKTRPAAAYTRDMELVQARCITDGGDPAAVNLLRATFPDGISTKALTRRMTRDEAREYNHGASGQMYRVFLRIGEGNRFRCRLCAADADEGGWKQAKDALRHLKRDHFGLGTCCDHWLVLLNWCWINPGLTSSPN